MKIYIIKFSLIAATFNAIWMLLYVVTFGIFAFHWGEIFRVACLICTFSFFTYLGIKSYKMSLPNSQISMKQALQVGIMIVVLSTTIYAIFWSIIIAYFIPNFADIFANECIEYNKILGKSSETMAKKTIEMNEYRVNYKKPLVNILYSYTEILPIGIILTIFCAYVLKNKRN